MQGALGALSQTLPLSLSPVAVGHCVQADYLGAARIVLFIVG